MLKSRFTTSSVWKFAAITTVVWILVFALTVSESLFYFQLHQKPAPYEKIILNDLFILFWIPISPLLFKLISGLFHRKNNWFYFGFQMFGLCLLSIFINLGAESLIHYFSENGTIEKSSYASVFAQLITYRFHSNLILGIGFIASCVAYLSYIESQSLYRKQTELNQSLMTAQLGVLKAQMKPHFLFNSLHAISGLVLKNKNDLAITVIAKLSDLLRESIDMDNKKWIPIREEVDFIKRYLGIYALRFGESLKYEFDIAEDVDELLIPPALLQPIVENSLVHGVVPNDNKGTIKVSITRSLESVEISVQDTGYSIDHETPVFKEGLGLSNTRKRLSSLFYDKFHLRFDVESSTTRIGIPALNSKS